MADTQLEETYAGTLKELSAQFERTVEAAQKQFEGSVQRAQFEMAEMIKQATQTRDNTPTEPQKPPTAAQWVVTKEGVKVLVLTEQAATSLLTLFDALGEVLGQLAKK